MSDISYSQEAALWKSVAELEGGYDAMQAEFERLEARIDRVRRRDRLSFAFALLIGALLGMHAVEWGDAQRMQAKGYYYTSQCTQVRT